MCIPGYNTQPVGFFIIYQYVALFGDATNAVSNDSNMFTVT